MYTVSHLSPGVFTEQKSDETCFFIRVKCVVTWYAMLLDEISMYIQDWIVLALIQNNFKTGIQTYCTVL